MQVGPVLTKNLTGEAIADAIKQENPEVAILNRGSYLRLACRDKCIVHLETIEKKLGRPFSLPQDLEAVMPAYAGRLRLSGLDISWEA